MKFLSASTTTAAAVCLSLLLLQDTFAWNSPTGKQPRRFGSLNMPSVDQGNIKTMDAWDSALKAASTGAAANSSSDPHARVGVRPDKDIQSIYRKNQEWKEGKLEEDPEFFNKLGSGHSPDYMWIGTF